MADVTHALTVSRLNAEAVFGLPWESCLRFARARGVEVYRIGRWRLIPAYPFLEALKRAAAEVPATTFADELAEAERDLLSGH